MNANAFSTMNYKDFIPLAGQKNKPNSNPILKRMNVNFCAKGYYESKPTFAANNPKVEINTAWSSAARIVTPDG